MSALSRTIGKAPRYIIRPAIAYSQTRSFWDGNFDSGWHKRFANKLSKDNAAWEKNVERLAKEMEAQREAMMARFQSYLKSGRDEAVSSGKPQDKKIDYKNPKYGEGYSWFDDPSDIGGRPPPFDYPRPSEAQIKDLIRQTTKEMLDAQTAEKDDRIRRLIKDQFMAQATSMKGVVEDWVRRSPDLPSIVAQEVAKTKKNDKIDPPLLRDALSKEMHNPQVVDMLSKAAGRRSDAELRNLMETAVMDVLDQSPQQILDIIQTEMNDCLLSREEVADTAKRVAERIFKDRERHAVEATEGAMLRWQEELESSLREQTDAFDKKISEISKSVASLQNNASKMGGHVSSLDAMAHSLSDSAKLDSDHVAAELQKIRDSIKGIKSVSSDAIRSVAVDTYKYLMREPPARESASKAAPPTFKITITPPKTAEKLEPALDRQLSDKLNDRQLNDRQPNDTSESAPKSPTSPPSYKIVHYDSSSGEVRIETPELFQSSSPSKATKYTTPPSTPSTSPGTPPPLGVGLPLLSSIHDELRRQGYKPLCHGDKITVFGRGPIDLARCTIPSDNTNKKENNKTGRTRKTLTTLGLASVGTLIVYKAHCVFRDAHLNDKDPRGRRIFQSFSFGDSAVSKEWNDIFHELERIFQSFSFADSAVSSEWNDIFREFERIFGPDRK